MTPHSTLGALPCFQAFFWNRTQLMRIGLCALAFLLVTSGLDAQPANLSQRVEELGSENARIRRDAAMYLSQMAASGQDMQDALPALIQALGDREEQVWFAESSQEFQRSRSKRSMVSKCPCLEPDGGRSGGSPHRCL